MTPTPTPVAVVQPISLSGEVVVLLLWNVAIALLIVLASLILARLARAATLRGLERTRADRSTSLLVGRVVFIAIAVVGALSALGLLGVPWTTVIALTSVLGLAVSLAMQDVLKNFVAGIYLLVERPFRIGEEIKVKEFVGRVETVDVRTTVLRTAEGEAVMVPNAVLFSEIILNRGLSPSSDPAPTD